MCIETPTIRRSWTEKKGEALLNGNKNWDKNKDVVRFIQKTLIYYVAKFKSFIVVQKVVHMVTTVI
jgi:hypothetical protein